MGRTWVWSTAETHFTGADQAWAAYYTSGSLGFLIWKMRLTLPELGVYNTEECIGGDAMTTAHGSSGRWQAGNLVGLQKKACWRESGLLS